MAAIQSPLRVERLLDVLSCADLSAPLTAENRTALLAQNPEAPEHSLAVRETCTTDDCTALPAEVAARVGVYFDGPGDSCDNCPL